MAREGLSVTTIGTCRLVDPMAAVARDPSLGIQCNAANVYGFTHTAREALQQISYLDGRALPQDMGCLLSATGEFKPLVPRTRPDAWVVEISSMKEVLLDGVYLQINYLERVFRERPALLRTFWQKPRETERHERERLLRADPAFAECSAIARHMLLHAHATQTTLESLEADMLALRDRVPEPMVFVTHINARTPAGKLLRGRVQLSGWMHTVAARHDLRLFDPTPHVNAAGLARALENGGEDLNHYAPAFLGVIGRKLHLLFLCPLITAKTMGRDMALSSEQQTVGDWARVGPAPDGHDAIADAGTRPLFAPASVVRAQIGRGEFAAADAALRQRLARAQDDAEAHLLLGRLALESKRPVEAVPALERARALAPGSSEAAILLVRALLRLERHDEGVAVATDLVQRWPSDARALSTAAQALRKAQRYQEAAQTLRTLAELWPADPGVRLDLGEVLLKARDYEAAHAAALEALRLASGELRAHTVRATALRRLKRPGALAACGIEAAPHAPSLACEIAEALLGQGCPEDAALVAAALPEASRPEPLGRHLVGTLEQRAKEAGARGDTPAAGAALKALHRLDPENPLSVAARRKMVRARIVEARAATKANQADRALTALKQALDLSPEDAVLLREAAIAAERAEEWDFASKAWRRTIDLGAGDKGAVARLGRAAVRAGDFAGGLAAWLRVLSDTPADAEARRMADWTLRQAVVAMRADVEAERLEAAIAKARLVSAHDADNRDVRRALKRIEEVATRHMETADDAPGTEAAARLVLEANPRADAAMAVLVRVLERGRRYAEALPLYESLAALRATDAALWVKVAKLHRMLRNGEASAHAAQRALRVQPGNAAALGLLGSSPTPARITA